ncbi:apolipoprotein N-acyltransferase [Algirhabdus cladophorae]|uniref:apolipoprotein N-acyltransferase n=1 Tax=Algirhabdus cladophorae TaxID=3377108 RepID=UPI003B849E3E
MATALLLFGLGALAGLGQAPFDLWPVAVLAFSAIFYVMRRAGFWQAWWIGFGYFALVLHWIIEPFLVDIARHGWMAPFALLLLSGGLALFWAAAGWSAARLTWTGVWRSFAFALALVVAEYLRANILTGFPWGLPAYSLSASGLLPIAGTWGPHGVGAILLVFCAGLAILVQGARALGVAVCAAAICFVVGGVAQIAPLAAPDKTATIRIIQPNAPQNEKWQRDKAQIFLDRQLDYTAADTPADLVLWPETAVAFSITDVAPLAAQAARGGTVIFGAQRFSDSRFYNALVTVGQGGEIAEIYDKHHLVPFGEYIPLGNQLGKWGIRGLAENDGGGFARGDVPKPQIIDGIGPVLAMICYESIFPRYSSVSRSLNADMRPNLIVVATNDAWFGQFAGPQQHLQQAQWRAAEQGVPVARSANTGISAMIDARGSITGSLAMNTAGFFDTALPPSGPPGLYAQRALFVDLGLVALCLFGLFILSRKKRIQ